MCGRMSFTVTAKQINQLFNQCFITPNEWLVNYNISPTQQGVVITNQQPNYLQTMEWGLIPNWASSALNKGNLINARAETLLEKPSFKMPINKRRCIVIADSFYEWKKIGKNKVPYRIFPTNGALLLMAGIWDSIFVQGTEKQTFSIITTTANQEMTSIHHRMPLLFTSPSMAAHWLQDLPIHEIMKMTIPSPNNILNMYRVTEKLNSAQYNSPNAHIPLPDIPTLF